MRKIRAIAIGLVLIGLVVGIVFFVVGYFQPSAAGLFIESTPAASVYINGEEMGRTPFKTTRKPEEVDIKLVPESFETPLAPFVTRINLVSGIQTVVKREFADVDENSSGEVISFEKTSKDETSLAVVSIPDSSQVSIDGQVRGFTPYKTSSITPGEHLLTVSAKGFFDKNVQIKTQKGFKLTAIVKLAPNNEPVKEIVEEEVKGEEESEEVVEEIKEMVEILPTGVGFLRVRKEPSTLGKEIAQVEPGKTYVLISTDEKTGWFEIEYDEEGNSGWISNQYAEIVEEEVVEDSELDSSSEEE